MKRITSIIALIAILIAVITNFTVTSVHAAVSGARIFVADYDSETGVFYGAVYTADDTFTPIKFWLQSTLVISSSANIITDSYGYMITNTFALDKLVFTTNHHRYNWSNMDNTDMVTLSDVTAQNGYMDGKLDGVYAQFNGFAVNGSAALLRYADADNVNGLGWIVQNGQLMSYAISNGESTPNNGSDERVLHVIDFHDHSYYGALVNVDGDSVTAVKFVAENGATFEDMLPAYNTIVTIGLELDERGYTGKFTAYSAEYEKVIRFTLVSLSSQDTIMILDSTRRGNMGYATIDGVTHQIFTNLIRNGMATMLRHADANSTHGSGWIVQNGTLMQTAATNDESTHTIVLPLIIRL